MRFCQSIALALLVGLLSGVTHAGTNGNLKGRITDVSTGEALPGVNILIVGSGRGGVTNEKGEYFITSVAPGSYILRVTSLGYKTVESKKVEINADVTSVFDFKLASEDIELEGVTVEGQAPLVDVKKTAGEQTFSRDKIEQLPNVKGVEDVLGLQAGVVRFGGQMFLRGGRANETQIMIDGVVVNDVGAGGGAAGTSTANEQLQSLYSGNSTSGAGGALSVSPNSIQSVSVSSSGLDAEFGNAQSGVVNITTKSGGDTYTGTFQARTDEITNQSFNERYFSANIGGPEPITSYLLPSLGVNIPGKIGFFMSGNFAQSDGPYAFNTSDFYNPTRRKIKLGGFLGSLLNDLGFVYSDRQDNDFSFNSKLSWQIGESDNLNYSYRANSSSNRPLYGSLAWRDRADSVASTSAFVSQNVIQWNHVLSLNSLLKGYVSVLETDRTGSIGPLAPVNYSDPNVSGNSRDPSSDGFYDLGTSQSWTTSYTKLFNTKFDFSSKVHEFHFLKVGFEYFYEEIQSTAMSFPAEILDPANQSDSIAIYLGRRGAYPGLGTDRWVTNVYPSRGALFAQDNIEFRSINIHIGLRYDFFYLGEQVFSNEWVSRWEYVTGEQADWLDKSSFWDQFTSGYFSPRLSIGYPISTRTVFYFNYGHFLQHPERDQLYHDPVPTSASGNYVGNPSLKPQKTIQYEAGFDQLVFDDLSLGIRGFYKDIFDYVTLNVRTNPDKYVNLDFASARGFEIIVTKQLSNRYSGSLGYTYQLAKGRSSNPFAAQATSALFGLPREVRLDWDQQHTVNLFLGYRVSPNDNFSIFGLPFNNWGASVTWNYGSGFPYTPFDPTVPAGSLGELYLKNTGDGPFTSEVNISLYKGFNIFDKLNLTATLDVTNLLNRRNVDLNAGGFNNAAGRPISYGDYTNVTREIYSWGATAGNSSFASTVPPYIFRAPRQIALGFRISWE